MMKEGDESDTKILESLSAPVKRLLKPTKTQ